MNNERLPFVNNVTIGTKERNRPCACACAYAQLQQKHAANKRMENGEWIAPGEHGPQGQAGAGIILQRAKQGPLPGGSSSKDALCGHRQTQSATIIGPATAGALLHNTP